MRLDDDEQEDGNVGDEEYDLEAAMDEEEEESLQGSSQFVGKPSGKAVPGYQQQQKPPTPRQMQ